MTCIGKDPRCPCQDGDACHYKDCGGTKAWPVPQAEPVAVKHGVTSPTEAQPVQEPVACRFCHDKKGCWAWQCYKCGEIDDVQQPAPPAAQRPWVGLTDEEQRELYKKYEMDGWGLFYDAIEAALRSKNT